MRLSASFPDRVKTVFSLTPTFRWVRLNRKNVRTVFNGFLRESQKSRARGKFDEKPLKTVQSDATTATPT
jgi:hypothetical protein